jgi:peroxiredoxin
MLRKITIILFVVTLIGFPVFATPALKTGSPAPSVKLPDINGKTIELNTIFGKKGTVLSFFASWSKSCKAELAFLQQLSKDYSKKGIKVIGISFDRKSKKLNRYLNENKIDFTVLHDRKLKTLKDYRILIIPTLFVIDKDGNIKSIYIDFDKNVEESVNKDLKKLITHTVKQ